MSVKPDESDPRPRTVGALQASHDAGDVSTIATGHENGLSVITAVRHQVSDFPTEQT